MLKKDIHDDLSFFFFKTKLFLDNYRKISRDERATYFC